MCLDIVLVEWMRAALESLLASRVRCTYEYLTTANYDDVLAHSLPLLLLVLAVCETRSKGRRLAQKFHNGACACTMQLYAARLTSLHLARPLLLQTIVF
jgi:hypothetical protein